MSTPVGRASALMVLLLLMIVIGGTGCASNTPPEVGQVDMSPPGSVYSNRRVGSGFSAEFTANRSRPLDSGDSTMAALVHLDAAKDLGGANVVVGTALPELVITGTTDSGEVLALGSSPSMGNTQGERGSVWFQRDTYSEPIRLPASVRDVTVTVHLGETEADARKGVSLTIPVSAMPIVKDPVAPPPHRAF